MNKSVIQSLREIFRRDLLRLTQEISSYTDEQKIWHTERKISNSAGNLCLHILGNLNTYVGRELGKSAYVRDREREFSSKGIAREQLIQQIRETMLVVDDTLANMDADTIEKEYPVKVFADTMSTGFFLIHLATHLDYHLGQVNYHRRLLDGKEFISFGGVKARTFS